MWPIRIAVIDGFGYLWYVSLYTEVLQRNSRACYLNAATLSDHCDGIRQVGWTKSVILRPHIFLIGLEVRNTIEQTRWRQATTHTL